MPLSCHDPETGVPSLRTGVIDVKELIAMVRLEDLNRRADEYFRQWEDIGPTLSKPFVDPEETPELLITFSHVLQGLRPFRGMRTLDFGAGSCWASRFLTQLGCEVIALDVSQAALDIGRELFRRNPIIGQHIPPRFLLFDGRRIDLPDNSVDAIVSLSAFHHVPNPDEVIREFARVSRNGAVVACSEPGPDHSRSPQAQQEMKTYGVVENDIDVGEIWRVAQEAGFASIQMAVFNPALVLTPINEFERLLEEEGRHWMYEDTTRRWMRERRLFFLTWEGERTEDSRRRSGLIAQLSVTLLDTMFAEGEDLRARVIVRNPGPSLWLPSDAPVGPVKLGATLIDATGASHDYLRHPLPNPRGDGMHPGEEVEFVATIPNPGKGRYRLKFDLVSEYVCWFESNYSPVVEVAFEVF